MVLTLQGIRVIHALLAAKNDLGKKVSGPCTNACIIAARDMRVTARVQKQSVAHIRESIHAICRKYTRDFDSLSAYINASLTY